MMKYIVTFIFLFSFCMLFGIQKREKNNLLSFVVQDLERSPMGHKSCLIIKTKDVPFLSLHFKDGYWVGPFYEELTEDFSSYSFPKENIYKVRDSKNIFVYDKNVKNNNRGAFHIYVVRDSIPIVNADDMKDTMFIEKDPFINYVKRARLYRQKGSIYINYHPDTLVMPKIVHDELVQ